LRRSIRSRLAHGSLLAYGVAGYVFLYAPIGILILFSFDLAVLPSFPMQGLTFKWYRELASDPIVFEALRNSLMVAIVTTMTSTTIGTMAAFPLVRRAFPLKDAYNYVIMLPMIIPSLMVGVMLLIFFVWMGIRLSLVTVVLGHVVVTIPFAIIAVASRLYGFDRSLEEAAADCGATPAQTFRHVTLPLIFPGVLAAALFTFTLSFDEFIVTFMTTGTQKTLPMYIWGFVRYAITPKINALATLVLSASFVLIVLSQLLLQRNVRPEGGRVR
jgi:spermidine/putrescine transport system permease protein